MMFKKVFCLWLLSVLLVGCGIQASPTNAPIPLPSLVVTPNPSLISTASITLAPQVTATVPASLPTSLPRSLWQPDVADFVPAGAQVIRATPFVDGGMLSWFVIYQENGSGRGSVIRHESERGQAYPLGGELFREQWTGNVIKDINQDGRIEIMVEGVVRGKATAVHVFQWNGKEYATLLALVGDEGVAIDDAGNNSVYDFTALQLLFPRSVIFRATHAEWERTAYVVRHDVLFLLGPPTTFNYPEEAVLAYYTHWNHDEPEPMWKVLGEPQKSRTPLAQLQALANQVEEVSVGELTIAEETSERAVVAARVTTTARGTQQPQTFKQQWRLQKEGRQWKLVELIQAGN